MVQYKLHYFDVRGLAEAIRLLFHYVGQPFEDITFTHEQWPNEKSKYFYGKVPMLEVDGKQLYQTGAILRYLSEKFGLAGKDEWEKAKLHELFDFYKEAYVELMDKYIYVLMGFYPGDAAKAREEVFLPGVSRFFPLFVQLLAQSGSGFFAQSGGVTYVDFVLAEFFTRIRVTEPKVFEDYPELIAHIERVNGLAQLQEYLRERKD